MADSVADAPFPKPPAILSGRSLRHLYLVLFERHRVMTVSELLETLRSLGYDLAGPQPNKRLADALAVDVRRGRLHRIGRGLYAYGRVSKTSAWRYRVRVHRALGLR